MLRRTIIFVVGLYVLGFVIFVTRLPKTPSDLRHIDGIVALTGGDTRLDAAVTLFEKGVGKRLLISGVNPQTTKAELKKLAHGGHRFDCCADLGYAAENTHGNAQEAASWARFYHFRKLLIVTARYHMPRSLAEFRATMPGMKIAAYPVEPESINLEGWWHNPRALFVLHAEYAKYLAVSALSVVDREMRALDRSARRGESASAS
ncbi:MAG: YdcF family protein [Alphaproteobacteria bacterium]|nr:YdcF family protein [Alphaproteobacteria bacterium]MDE2109793.1 YdcF family protein [Alphaproteobacteria bacterium]MDE2495680.1 YdcF family protein [Alphaproteobacteria bacterium]